MLPVRMTRSSGRRRLTGAAARAGVEAGQREELVGAVLRELAVRLTPAQWRELCGWLPWDVCSLAGARHAGRVPPREDVVTAVAAATGLPDRSRSARYEQPWQNWAASSRRRRSRLG
jgi:hypothetical protein